MANLQKLYDKILNKIPIISETDPTDWTATDVMVYIAYKYKEKFNQDFVFSYAATPSKSIEYRMVNRIFMMLQAKSGDAILVKDYIDWFYDNYKSKRRFTSLGALAKTKLISDYKEFKSKPVTINKTKALNDDIKTILKTLEESSYIETYGDLYFFMESLKQDKDLNTKFLPIKNSIIDRGFDFDSLNNVI